jgi:hypothetical protein
MANSTATRRYVALTTHGGGWWVVGAGEAGESREQVEERAQRDICGGNWDQAKTIEQDTELKNLQVVSYSAAKRAFPKAMSHYEYQPWDD